MTTLPFVRPLSTTTVLSVYALMIGTLQLARTLTDRRLSDDLLEQGIRNALSVFER